MNLSEHMQKPKSLIILEGPDCGGKTTLMRELTQSHELLAVHNGPFPRLSSAQLPRFYVEAMMPMLHGYQSMVFDRSWLSEPIYGLAFRNGTDRVGPANRRHLERIAMKHGGVVVLCLPPWEAVKTKWLERKKADSEAEYLDKIEQLKIVYDRYVDLQHATDLPVVVYDYTRHGNQLNQLRRLIELQRPATHKGGTMVGNLDAKCIIVGEKPSDHTDYDAIKQFPFCSFSPSGSSRWLTQKLSAAGIHEMELLWLNADDGAYQLKDLWRRPTFALGDAAAKALDMAGTPYIKVAHPAHHMRFSSSKPYELIDLIKAAK